jgi:mono/diheme cytochrome c family protein
MSSPAMMRMTRAAALFAALVTGTMLAAVQEPPAAPAQARPAGQGRGGAGQSTREFLGLGRAPDLEVAARGEKLYAAACAFCHGPDARGAQGPSLLRSEIVLHDDKGELIGPVVLNGRPDKGMPPMSALVTTGLYARIRNPIYVFGGLMSVGILIFAHRPRWLLIWVPLIPLQVFRVRKEEQVLEAKFGDAYRDYKRRTWF